MLMVSEGLSSVTFKFKGKHGKEGTAYVNAWKQECVQNTCGTKRLVPGEQREQDWRKTVET